MYGTPLRYPELNIRFVSLVYAVPFRDIGRFVAKSLVQIAWKPKGQKSITVRSLWAISGKSIIMNIAMFREKANGLLSGYNSLRLYAPAHRNFNKFSKFVKAVTYRPKTASDLFLLGNSPYRISPFSRMC